jgi:NADP-dependent 3-hydroxy acid dehydrogenase YdfG
MRATLQGKIAIITGASSGVGAAAARQFAASGTTVVLAARRAESIAALAAELGGLALATDVTRLDQLELLVKTTIKRFGRIDILVNNAGTNERGNFDTISPEGIAAIVDTNLKAPMLLTRLAMPHLIDSGGVVINVASIAGHVPLPGEAPYSASKWGLRGFTFAVREEMQHRGVALCAVSPGPIATPFIFDDIDHTPDLVFSQPFLTADEVAEAILACASDRKRERAMPRSTLFLVKLVARFPALQEMLRPSLETKGRKIKARMIAGQRTAFK